jgi:hypothetical protein
MVEIYRSIHYIVLYIIKKFYEIIKFFDNATSLKMIKSRILGFIFMSIGYFLIGNNFFYIYLISLVVIFLIYNILNIYTAFKKKLKDDFNENDDIKVIDYVNTLDYVLIFFGFSENKLENMTYEI